MSQDRRFTSNGERESVDELLRRACERYDEGRLTLRQFRLGDVLTTLKRENRKKFRMKWSWSDRPDAGTAFEDVCSIKIKLKRKRPGGGLVNESYRYVYVESFSAESIKIVSQIEETLPTKDLIPSQIVGALIDHFDSTLS